MTNFLFLIFSIPILIIIKMIESRYTLLLKLKQNFPLTMSIFVLYYLLAELKEFVPLTMSIFVLYYLLAQLKEFVALTRSMFGL